MAIVDKLFLKKTKEISFMELKRGAEVKIGDYILKDNIPLPIRTSTLINEIKEGYIGEELDINRIIEGIIYILGIDKEFKHNDAYKQILYNYSSTIEEYILNKGTGLINAGNAVDGAIYFRALIELNDRTIEGLFNYSLSLESIASENLNGNHEEKGLVFLKESTRQLEKILDIYDSFSLAYYKLGYHYKYYGKYQKARLIWDKFMKLDDKDYRLQEIREQLELVEDDADYEQSMNHIANGQFEKALGRLLPLSYKYKNWWNIFYLIGLAYKGIDEYEEAIEFFHKALDIEGVDINVYNELGICLFSLGEINEAIDIFNKGIRQQTDDYKIIFNRGLAYLNLSNIGKAIEDIRTAHSLNPNDIMVLEQLRKLEQQYL